MTAQPVKQPIFTIKYEGTDISRDLEALLISLTYTDRLHASSSDLEIVLENRDRRWMNTWLPKKGDEVLITLGYKGGDILDAGRFEFDDAEFSGSPDKVRLGFLATDVTSDLRTERTEPYEKVTLKKIADEIAKRHGLTLVGEIPEIQIDRATQNEETDLQFLVKLADEYDLLVKVENKQLIFYRWEDLEKRPSIATLTDAEIRSYRIPWSSNNVYKKAVLTFQDPSTKKEIKHEEVDPTIEFGDTLKVSDRVESKAQAIEKCKAALLKKNRRQVEPSFTLMEGRSDMVAGANFLLKGNYGKFIGKYQVMQVRHSLTYSRGWECDLEARKIDRVKAD
jgi:uncharacterized protein